MILNLGHQHLVLNPHYTRDHLIDTDRRWIKGAHNHNGPIDKAQVNHYYFKSLEEWEIRCNTPRGNGIMRPRDYWYQSRYAYSKIHDTTALDFAIKTGVVKDR